MLASPVGWAKCRCNALEIDAKLVRCIVAGKPSQNETRTASLFSNFKSPQPPLKKGELELQENIDIHKNGEKRWQALR
jgi:hypothetical protein